MNPPPPRPTCHCRINHHRYRRRVQAPSTHQALDKLHHAHLQPSTIALQSLPFLRLVLVHHSSTTSTMASGGDFQGNWRNSTSLSLDDDNKDVDQSCEDESAIDPLVIFVLRRSLDCVRNNQPLPRV